MVQIPFSEGATLKTTFTRPPLEKTLPRQPVSRADRAVLAQPQVEDPQDTDLQKYIKALHGKTPAIRANSTATVKLRMKSNSGTYDC